MPRKTQRHAALLQAYCGKGRITRVMAKAPMVCPKILAWEGYKYLLKQDDGPVQGHPSHLMVVQMTCYHADLSRFEKAQWTVLNLSSLSQGKQGECNPMNCKRYCFVSGCKGVDKLKKQAWYRDTVSYSIRPACHRT